MTTRKQKTQIVLLLLLSSNCLFCQDIENPEWGFVDFDASTVYYPSALTGTAIQAAIDKASSKGGGTVLIDAGTIEITENINMKSNVKLKGKLNIDSTRAVTIRAKNRLAEGMIVARTVVKNTTVEDLILDGGSFDHHGLSYIYGPDNFLISNNSIVNIGYEKINTDSLILESRADNPTAINMWSDGDFAERFTIKGNTIVSVAKHGINVNNGRRFILQDNYVERAFMGYDASTGSQYGEILGNEIVNCIFGAKIIGYESNDVIMHHNNHHHLDDTPYYSKGWGWEYDSGTALVLQGEGTGIVVRNNTLSGTTADKGIAYWDGGQLGVTVTDNNFTPSAPTAIEGYDQNTPLSNGFRLAQNYPNPFHSGTTITFTVPDFSAVSITVHNALGEKVATLMGGLSGPGNQQVWMDASSLTAGLYVYKLKTTHFTLTKQMICIK